MPTSELSNALNPYASQSRSRPSITEYSSPYEPAVQPSQSYIPHRSELELAISEPPPPAPPIVATETRARPFVVGGAVQELLRIVSATREAQEIERKRRLAWEQEQEAKYAQRQAEMDRRFFEVQQEIITLRSAAIGMTTTTNNMGTTISMPPPPSGLFTPQYNMSPAMTEQRPPQPSSPISPLTQSAPYSQAMFLQGSSNNPLPGPSHLPQYGNHTAMRQEVPQQHPQTNLLTVQPPPQSVTPSPSPQLTSVEPLLPPDSEASTPPRTRKKRLNSELSGDEGNSSSSESNTGQPMKRVNHHDRRCLTIHHAMRAHILLAMDFETDKELPDSHIEGQPLDLNQPVRFVWDKTTKQSVHNARMKARVISDLKEKRRLYKHVSNKDFGKKTLDAAFEQSFVTFRQKFKTQRDARSALTYKSREENKARRARHLSRRKTKLSNRSEARVQMGVFEHVTFDGAFQVECMSSEESEDELNLTSSHPGLLRTRGYAWRSTRLIRFYTTLDDEEKVDKSTRPRRGVGRKERCIGPLKEGFYLPPEGVATWMISRRWFHETQKTQPDLPDALKKLVEDPEGFDWGQFHLLGDESEDEETPSMMHHDYNIHSQSSMTIPQHYTMSSSSLDYALV